MKIITGRVGPISQNSVVICGGVVVKHQLMLLAVNLENTKSEMTIRKMKIMKARTTELKSYQSVSAVNN